LDSFRVSLYKWNILHNFRVAYNEWYFICRIFSVWHFKYGIFWMFRIMDVILYGIFCI
jgi:hypothetical protein